MNDNSSPKFLGYHHEDTLPIKRGDKVRIRKGTTIYVATGDYKVAARDQVVIVHHVLCGMIAHKAYHGDDIAAKNPKVVWAGSGGYWHEVDINDVEKV